MFDNIPQKRVILYMLIAGMIPLILVTIHFISNLNSIDNVEQTLFHVRDMVHEKEQKQATNIAIRSHYKDADRFYIDKYLETLSFLEPEIESLQKVINNKNFPEDEAVKRRLELLTGPGNTLIFSEGVVQKYPFFQETTETLVHPVEVNISDIKKILARIEGTEINSFTPGPNRPQLLILEFKIDKKIISEKNEDFILNLKLLKREFT
jgi:hypothetical protein